MTYIDEYKYDKAHLLNAEMASLRIAGVDYKPQRFVELCNMAISLKESGEMPLRDAAYMIADTMFMHDLDEPIFFKITSLAGRLELPVAFVGGNLEEMWTEMVNLIKEYAKDPTYKNFNSDDTKTATLSTEERKKFKRYLDQKLQQAVVLGKGRKNLREEIIRYWQEVIKLYQTTKLDRETAAEAISRTYFDLSEDLSNDMMDVASRALDFTIIQVSITEEIDQAWVKYQKEILML